ncbi:MAG: exonuclease domain-containing protein [Gordonia sp. (in: high G+C Gram-positive bacteria)]|uniref:exonuclease domain-containing protein n=1 Tax=Gordonia sp. (in: high G+C Gram-positive bacteria) TaxID=84139 RepID=UPI003BB60B04
MSRGFAVLDFETTGFAPGYGHRIVEVGAVFLTPDLQIEGSLETLVNPKRDVGPTSVHGVTARDVFDAPTFDQVIPTLLDLLDGRVIVGHNVAFDLRFLAAELERAGFVLPEVVVVDTLTVARRLLASQASSFKLHELTAHLGISIDDVFARAHEERRPAHSAYGDALVTSYLFGQLVTMSAGSPLWAQHLELAQRVAWPPHPGAVTVPLKRRGDVCCVHHPAPTAAGRLAASRSVDEVLSALGAPIPGPAATAEYAALLNDALDDRVLDAAEVDALIETARRLGLDSMTLGSLHRGHFEGVVRDVWADGVLTDDEAADVIQVGRLLGIDDDSLLRALTPQAVPSDASTITAVPIPPLTPGAIIVLTGEMTLDRSHLEAEIVARGYLVGKNITKKSSLVIAADPYSQSRKTQKAREYGISVLGEEDGLALLRR